MATGVGKDRTLPKTQSVGRQSRNIAQIGLDNVHLGYLAGIENMGAVDTAVIQLPTNRFCCVNGLVKLVQQSALLQEAQI